MRNFKRFLALAMAMLMLVSATVITTGAAEEGDYSVAAQKLASINILKGDTNGNLMLDQGVTRWHTALFFVQALTGRTDGAEWNATKQSETFTDVPEYGTAIDYAAGIGLIRGRGNGIYGYSDSIIYQDMLVMAVRALGYETEDMNYPYGHILAAEKLGLTENVATSVNYTDALTRGETAQIIWNMLGTQIAAVDPLTKKILYPGDVSVSGMLGNEAGDTTDKLRRVTLLEEAKFSQGVIDGVITEFVEAKTSQDVNIAVVETAKNGTLEMNAADLGITEKSQKASYLNLPVTLYVNCKENTFASKYDAYEANEEAKVVFAEFVTFTSVVNLGDENNITYTPEKDQKPAYITLGGTKFAEDKYTYDLRMLEEDGWQPADLAQIENFLYDSKDGQIGANSYGEIAYKVLVDEETEEQTLLMLYKPFAFGKYIDRSLRYQKTAKDTSFILIGTYDADMSLVNKSEYSSHFIERLLGEDFLSNNSLIVDIDTPAISERYGKASAEVTVTGATVKNNDYMFYFYNELDNVLHIAKSCGNSKSGILSSYSTKNSTAKLDGTNYTFGFPGAFTNTEMPVVDAAKAAALLDKLAAGEKNATYIVVDDHVVYLGGVDNSKDAKQHSYAIVSVEPELLAELLEMDDADEYIAATAKTEGLYLDANGNISIAVLNTTSGKWELAALNTMEMEYDVNGNGELKNTSAGVEVYDAKEDELPVSVAIAENLENYSIFGSNYTFSDELVTAIDHLKNEGIFMVRANKSKVYTLAPIVDDCVEFGTTEQGILFSDVAAKTNLIKDEKDTTVDAARVTMSAKTVTVIISADGKVGVRTGIQKNANSVEGAGRFYTATNNLIVLALNDTYDVALWEDQDIISEDETYYVALKDADAEYERLEDGTYDITVSGLFNLRTFKTVSAIKVNVEALSEADWYDALLPGTVLHMEENGDMSLYGGVESIKTALLLATDMRDDDDEKFQYVDLETFEFVNADTIVADFIDPQTSSTTVSLDGVDAVDSIKVIMATLNLTGMDFTKDYDIDNIVLPEEYNETVAAEYDGVVSVRYNKENDKVFGYTLDALDEVVTLSAPVRGQLDQYVIDTVGSALEAAADGDDYFENAGEFEINLTICGQFDADTGAVTLYVVKTAIDADTHIDRD